MADIITDVGILHKISEKADNNEVDSIISQLQESIPEDALGLAAIQINIPRRIFIANLSSGSYVFVNPKITWMSTDRVPSVEGCLSIPDGTRCIERHSQIEVSSDPDIEIPNSIPVKRFSGQDAFIIQHEYDHLNGILITDYAEVKTPDQKRIERNQKREQKIAASRTLKNNKKEPKSKSVSKKMSVRRKGRLQRQTEKQKRADRTARRRKKIRVEIEERYKADQKNLFNDEQNTA